MSSTELLQRLAAANTDTGPAPEGSEAFTRSVLELLDRIEYRRCETGEDREEVFRLRYKAYLKSGMVGPSESGMIRDAMDDVANVMCFGVYIDGELVSTLRLHHLTREQRQSPSTSVYRDLLEPQIERGLTFIDPSRFAADPEKAAQYKVLPYVTLRLAAMACIHAKPDYCLSTVTPPHAAFYRRVFGAEAVGPLRSYPALNYKVLLYRAEFARIVDRTLARYPFFRSSPMERRLMFGDTPLGEVAPLTILPTAKYIVRAA